MSKLSGTVTSTPEEKWGLMADTVDVASTEPETPAAVTPEEKSEKSSAEKSSAEKTSAEKTSAGKTSAGKTSAESTAGLEKVEAPADLDSATDRRSSRKLFTLRRIAVGALVVVAVAAIIVAAVLGWKLNEQNKIDAAADDAQAAAEQYAVTLTSVSSDSLDENFAAVLDGATGEFKDMYSQSSGQLRDLLVENKANAEGTVIDSGIKSATTSKVEVILFVDQSVSNTATPDPRIDRSRVLMTMEKIDGRWLASKVDLP